MALDFKSFFGSRILPDVNVEGLTAVSLEGWRSGDWSEREWWVYFFQDEHGGPIKIGRSTFVGARLCGFQIGYPFGRLRCIGVIRGPKVLEGELHARFARHHLRGEWYRPVDELINFVASLRGPA